MNGKVCVLGSFNVDIVARVPRFPRGGETLVGDSSFIGPGGKGANQALAAARAGGRVHYIGKCGNDEFATFAHNHLESCGFASFTLYRSDEQATGRAVIYVSGENAENMIAIYPGANIALTEDEIDAVRDEIRDADVLLLQLETNLPALAQAMALAQGGGTQVICNPAPCNPALRESMAFITIITPNESEASLLSGLPVENLSDAEKAALAIAAMGPRTVIITLGSRGLLLFDRGGFTHVPAFPARPVDTTGAGDAFNGAFAAALAEGQNLLQACEYAAAFASLAVERAGASNLPNREEALVRLRHGPQRPA